LGLRRPAHTDTDTDTDTGATDPSRTPQFLVLRRQHLVPPEAIDGLALADGGEPGTGIARRPVDRPLRQRVDQRILGELLGQSQVPAAGAGQHRHDTRELDTEHRLDRGSRIGGRHATDSTTTASNSVTDRRTVYSGPETGRTRTSPSPNTARKRFDHSVASARSRHS